MQKRFIAILVCMVLVSAMSVTSVVSARQVGSSTVKQNGIAFVIAAIYKFWQSKVNPTQIEITQPITMLVAGILTLVTLATGYMGDNSVPVGG